MACTRHHLTLSFGPQAWAVLCLLGLGGCSGSNKPSVASKQPEATTSAGTTANSNSMGAAGSGKVSAGSPAAGSGTATAGSKASAGNSSAAAGNSSATAGTQASPAAGSGAPNAGSGGAASGMFSPLCSDVPATAAGVPTKGSACTAMDSQLCYKTCGPQSVGFKSETCTSGSYVEQTGCSFPAVDYTCYKIPAMVDAKCPTMAPQASQACDVAACTLCNVGGNYLDSSGASKAGYCVCPEAGSSGMRKWSCASTTAWPCPSGQGC